MLMPLGSYKTSQIVSRCAIIKTRSIKFEFEDDVLLMHISRWRQALATLTDFGLRRNTTLQSRGLMTNF